MTHTVLGVLALTIGASVAIEARSPRTTGALIDLERRLEANADDLAAANEYRLAIIQAGEYDRAIAFFGWLVEAHPQSANAFLNFGYAYVDKIPAAGAITQVILANSALTRFSRAIELRPSWIGFYTRGFSYLFWPKIFGRVALGLQDLERALKLQRAEAKRPFHVRTYVALGDGYWKADDPQHARETWEQGLKEFPGTTALEDRLRAEAPALSALIEKALDPAKRVDTDLSELWSQP
jgi:tetratricopeptide (TPR) repeat protein